MELMAQLLQIHKKKALEKKKIQIYPVSVCEQY